MLLVLTLVLHDTDTCVKGFKGTPTGLFFDHVTQIPKFTIATCTFLFCLGLHSPG